MTDSEDRTRQLMWKAVSTGSGILAGMAARQLLQKVWGTVGDSGLEPPLNPADRRIGWKPALQWAISAGVGVGVTRLVGQRLAAAGWEKATGSPPPGVSAEST